MDAPLLEAPDAGDEAVDQERLCDVAVVSDDLAAQWLRQHSRPVGVGEQDVVPLRQEANRCGCVWIRQVAARNVEQLACLLVAEPPQLEERK